MKTILVPGDVVKLRPRLDCHVATLDGLFILCTWRNFPGTMQIVPGKPSVRGFHGWFIVLTPLGYGMTTQKYVDRVKS